MKQYRYTRLAMSCSCDGCSEPMYCKQVCSKHYQSGRKRKARADARLLAGKPAWVRPERRTCSVRDCVTTAAARGFCYPHYRRFLKWGDPLINKVRPRIAHLRCLVDGCEGFQKCQGYCALHYARLRKNGDPLVGARRRSMKGPKCSVDGCACKPFARGVCQKHYKKLDKVRLKDRRCSIDGCDRWHEAQGFCGMHYSRLRVHGDPHKTLIQKTELGTRIILPSGYVKIRIGIGEWQADRGGWALEHRYVVAKRIGRPLLPIENVHHIDGDKTNNESSNLELWTSSQPSGQRVTDKIAWARQILSLYGDLKV